MAPTCQASQHPCVTTSLGNPLPVSPFEQRNQVLARQPKAVAQLRRGGRPQLPQLRLQRIAEFGQRRRSRKSLLVKLLYTAFPGEVRQQPSYRGSGELSLQLDDGRHLPV